MTIVTRKDRSGTSRAQLALAGVLAVVLVVVVVVQLPTSTDADDVLTAPISELPGWQGEPAAAAPIDEPTNTAATTPSSADRQWPELSMKEIVACDPLAAPAWYQTALGYLEPDEEAVSAAAEETADSLLLAELQQQGAAIVLFANGQRIATIGDRQIRVGDKIEGYQVTDITDEGVILTKIRAR